MKRSVRAAAPALQLLGGLSAQQFLRRYWQKQPLLIRQALPGFKGVLTRAHLLRLAGHEDCHARLIWRAGKRWHLRDGPLSRADFAALDAPPNFGARRAARKPWTVLVQDVNHVVPAADALMRRFDFIPYARLDDLMVSYATPGGGVGPHVDSYDVFLLQGAGERVWQISRQRNLGLVPDAPIKLLQNFVPQEQWVLQPGDMLYLPPGVAHCGTAASECLTYSIGFRAPAHGALQQAWLQFLEDRCEDLELYADPDLRPSRTPAAITPQIKGYCQRILEGVKWRQADITMFLGQYLSEPKATTFFRPPRAALPQRAFVRIARAKGVVLHAKTRMLYSGADVFVNGARHRAGEAAAVMQRLADARGLSAREVSAAARIEAAAAMLFQWYTAGYLSVAAE